MVQICFQIPYSSVYLKKPNSMKSTALRGGRWDVESQQHENLDFILYLLLEVRLPLFY